MNEYHLRPVRVTTDLLHVRPMPQTTQPTIIQSRQPVALSWIQLVSWALTTLLTINLTFVDMSRQKKPVIENRRKSATGMREAAALQPTIHIPPHHGSTPFNFENCTPQQRQQYLSVLQSWSQRGAPYFPTTTVYNPFHPLNFRLNSELVNFPSKSRDIESP